MTSETLSSQEVKDRLNTLIDDIYSEDEVRMEDKPDEREDEYGFDLGPNSEDRAAFNLNLLDLAFGVAEKNDTFNSGFDEVDVLYIAREFREFCDRA